MPKTKARALNGLRECDRLFEELSRRGKKVVRMPVVLGSSCRKGSRLYGVPVRHLMLFGFQQFYRGTELALWLKSATAVIDVTARTIILRNVRLRHRFKYLPNKVHDIQLY
jgi:hypothetical protein